MVSNISHCHILLIMFTIALQFTYGDCISCYNCSSNSEIDCSEKFDEDSSRLTARSCDGVFEARYCIKTTGIFEGEIGTKRFCSSRDYGNYCEYIRRLGDEREYRSCVYTCTRDACNSGIAITGNLNLLLVIAFVTLNFH